MAAALLNFMAFQIGWFACMLGAAHRIPLAGTAVALTIVMLHVARAADPYAELKLIGATVGVGAMLDAALALPGLITFTSGAIRAGATAHWMLALWMLYATTLNVSLRWLKERVLVAVVFGAIGGPLAYLAGEKLGALRLSSATALVAIGIGWAVIMWLLVLSARRFDGVATRVVAAHEA